MLKVRTVPELGTLAISVNEGPDRAIVHRSWGLFDNGKLYGSKFRFAEHMRVKNVLVGVLLNLAIAMGMVLLSLPPVR